MLFTIQFKHNFNVLLHSFSSNGGSCATVTSDFVITETFPINHGREWGQMYASTFISLLHISSSSKYFINWHVVSFVVQASVSLHLEVMWAQSMLKLLFFNASPSRSFNHLATPFLTVFLCHLFAHSIQYSVWIPLSHSILSLTPSIAPLDER